MRTSNHGASQTPADFREQQPAAWRPAQIAQGSTSTPTACSTPGHGSEQGLIWLGGQSLSEELLTKSYAVHSLDIDGAWDALSALAEATPAQLNGDCSPSPATAGAPRYPAVARNIVRRRHVETTGFSGLTDDRLIEIAVVHTDPNCHITGSWTTLVNPGGDPGPTWLHGIRHNDLEAAPHFAELTGWLTNLLADCVLVGHNAPNDLSFLTTEFERADIDPPGWSSLCTMELARLLSASASLSLDACCTAADIPLAGAHTAIGDAEATARLLGTCLSAAAAKGLHDLAALGCEKPVPAQRHAGLQNPPLRPRSG
ncbi:3'-5' exonuclease [Kribbella sp. NPDC005582]|uniref:3'-5' exonuclease n=1 Tax=Kribbella sp. NPDC005582 TaxID=3156893 RepID=UPI0033AFC78A